MGKLYLDTVAPPDLNKNTEWFMYPGVWSAYILIIFFSWLVVFSISGCNPGMAWTIVNLAHFAVTYHYFHWKKGTPFAEDQGIYNMLTWWEQVDNGKQLTSNRKFLMVLPVVLYLIASHTTDYQHPMLFFNTLAVTVLVIAKFPNMHKMELCGSSLPETADCCFQYFEYFCPPVLFISIYFILAQHSMSILTHKLTCRTSKIPRRMLPQPTNEGDNSRLV